MIRRNRHFTTKLLFISACLGVSLAFLTGCARQPKPARVIKVEMKKYAVSPAEIHVRQGEAIALELTTADVQHGFDVPDMGISEPVQPGQTARIALKTDRKGTFEVTCGVICGARHEQMRGRIIVD
jgi:heme/copper-type cytochrome/quinol oxidase subunit 2